jgi:TRAP-type C4-dicarboxylate transport system permease large subunit
MPILFMALIALGVFMVMGLMLFYAAYAETKLAHKRNEHTPEDLHKDLHREIEHHAPVA